jgi:NAD(P)H-hydrate epimerase
MKILTSQEMQNIDRRTIDEMKVPGLLLMESAGRQVSEALLTNISRLIDPSVLILCGKGNNGGDGFTAARYLALAGIVPEVVLVACRRRDIEGDAATMLEALEGIGVPTAVAEGDEDFADLEARIQLADVIVDALLGTGLKGPVRGLASRVIEAVNEADGLVVSVDLPSGLSGDSPEVSGPAIEADVTFTFGCPKITHMFPPAEGYIGELHVLDIGIPAAAVAAEGCRLDLLEEEGVARLVPDRPVDGHKGDFGRVLVVAGSVGMAGAAGLVARGAQRVGAGLVTVATPRPVRAEVAVLSPETMTEPLESTEGGSLGAGAATHALEVLDRCTVLGIGPGLGLHRTTQNEIRTIVRESQAPVVLDADGVNAFAGPHAEQLVGTGRELLVSPHPGEMARLLGISAAEVQADRVAAVRTCAERHRCVAVLKGYRTLIAVPEGEVFVNPTGNAGMATGGSGDVLTGILTGLLAQGLPALEAAVLGVFVHGLAGDLAAAKGTELTLVSSDLLDLLPEAIARLERRLRNGEEEDAS